MLSEQKTCWIGTSWKMHKLLSEATDFVQVLLTAEITEQIQPFVVPSYTTLREVSSLLSNTRVLVGAQNMHWESRGAWTGEISAPMLKDCGAELVELGHSERREHFGETNAHIGLKVKAALDHGLIPLICIGERLEDREQNRTTEVLSEQIAAALEPVKSHASASNVIFAYEPVWAIGENGQPAEPSYANAQQSMVINQVSSILDTRIPCLYGGSVTLDNCVDLISCSHIDGLFIGRSAWNIDGYLAIVARCAAALKQYPS